MAKGKLYGVSTGPGDPELMTVKAMNTIRKVQVIAAPRTKGENCMALDIVKGIMDVSDKEIEYLDFAMKRDSGVLNSTHRQQADQLIAVLETGKDVAMLNIGDASLFGTWCYIRDLVAEAGFEVETIPGVTSFSAIAAVLEQSLTTMNEPLMVIPGSYSDMKTVFAVPGSKVLMKSFRQLGAVKEAIEEAGLIDRASLVANCGLPTQRVYKDIRETEDNEGYFATILVRGDEEI